MNLIFKNGQISKLHFDMDIIRRQQLTSNARPRTRSSLSRRNCYSELSANYLFINFQKKKEAHSCCVFLLSSSRRFSSVS
jgi:hypothetical protein